MSSCWTANYNSKEEEEEEEEQSPKLP